MPEPMSIRAADLFGAGPASLVPLHGGNFSQVYAFRREEREVVLRLTLPDAGIDAASMESILDFMRWLAENGLHVPRPLRSTHGRLVESVPGEGGEMLATAVEKAPGILAERLPFEVWNEQRFELLGRTAGKLHRLSQSYQPPQGISRRPEWYESDNNYNLQEDLDQVHPIVLDKYAQARREVLDLPHNGDRYGLIHADLQCANFFLEPQTNTLTLFDFDDCCYGWYLMDIALPLLDFLVVYPGLEREAFANKFLTSFLRGYRSEYPLEPKAFQQLPLFLKLLEIGLTIQVETIAAHCTPDSWVGKFMAGRLEKIKNDRPFVELDMQAVLAGMRRKA